MILDIKPIRYDYISCFDAPVISVALWLKRDYEFLFAKSWYFEFKPKKMIHRDALKGKYYEDSKIFKITSQISNKNKELYSILEKMFVVAS